MTDIYYSIAVTLEPDEFISVLERSGLAERRPVDQPKRIKAMVENSNLIVCARNSAGLLVGVSRAVTDYSYCCYLSDLAVDQAFQGLGIGKELVRRTHEAAGGKTVSLILLSAPGAMSYYPNAGFDKADNCFIIPKKT